MLFNRFKTLDRDDSGTIMIDDLLYIPEVALNPLHIRIAGIFGLTDGKHMNFLEFVKAISIFHYRSSTETKSKGLI